MNKRIETYIEKGQNGNSALSYLLNNFNYEQIWQRYLQLYATIYAIISSLIKNIKMSKFVFSILTFLFFLSCEKEEINNEKFPDGTYIGTFQREPVWSEGATASITLTFSSNKWSGSGEREKYPALCRGTYSIKGDTIIFENECPWTAEFDWSLILSGKYLLTKTRDTIEFSRNYRSATSDTHIDKYKIHKEK